MSTNLSSFSTVVKPQLAMPGGNGHGAPAAWYVADPDASHGADLAHQWGHEDATEGNKRNGSCFVLLSAEYNSYHQGYNEGLRLRQQLQGDVCQGALDECAWFDEIVGVVAGDWVCSSCGATFDNRADFMAHRNECDGLTPDEGFEVLAEEWIGMAFSTQPYLF
jgi:hypothetical protein